jgi:uncharacterized repeat protein (TIGR01451 family)
MKNIQKITIFILLVGIATMGIVPAFLSVNVYAVSRRSPIAYTEAAGGITPTSIVLQGRVNPGGAETMYWFEYGTTAALGSRTDILSAGFSQSESTFVSRVHNLVPNTLYYYRVIAQNAYGRSTGTTLTAATNLEVYANTSGVSTVYKNNTSALGDMPPVIVRENNTTPVSRLTYGTENADLCMLVAPVMIPQEARAGEDFTYTITYRNGCSYDAQNVVVKVITPLGITIKPSSLNTVVSTEDVNGVSYIVGSVLAGAQESITIEGTIEGETQKGETLLFSTILSYTDAKNVSRASTIQTSLPVVYNQSLTASVFDAFRGIFQSGWFSILLLVVVGYLVYRIFFMKKKNKDDEVDVLKA